MRCDEDAGDECVHQAVAEHRRLEKLIEAAAGPGVDCKPHYLQVEQLMDHGVPCNLLQRVARFRLGDLTAQFI
jgi:hypothetical protein